MFPKLIFTMDIPNEPTVEMLYGKLILSDEEKNVAFMATAGLPKFQYFGGWKVPRHGVTPPRTDYTVSTQKLWMPDVKGVEGSFYAISPFLVNADGVQRGDFGIHFDANIKGSSGCIVIKQQDHWDLFREAMKEYHDLRIKAVPLEVKYI